MQHSIYYKCRERSRLSDKITLNTMKRNINKLASESINNFLLDSNTGNIRRLDGGGGTSMDMFAHIDDRKRVIAFLRGLELDVFARGTKMPAKIQTALASASWMTIKEIDPSTSGVRSMWD